MLQHVSDHEGSIIGALYSAWLKLTIMVLSCPRNHGQICCRNTDYVRINGHDRTITVILAKHCIEFPDDGSSVILNMLEQFQIFYNNSNCICKFWNCVIPVFCVRTLGIVDSQTQLSLRCNFSDYVLKNNYMFWPMMAIVRLPWEYLGTYCKLYRAHNVEISTQLARCDTAQIEQTENKSK